MTISPPTAHALDAASLAVAIADRLIDPEPIIATGGPAATSLSRGLAGTALLHARMSRHADRFAKAADAHWTRAARINTDVLPRVGGVFNGAGALAASLILGTPYLPDPDSHNASISRGIQWLTSRAAAVAAWQHDQRNAGQAGTPWQTFDVINGLAGIGRILLAASQTGHADAEQGLRTARDALTAMIEAPDGERPGWWRPAPRHPAALADPHNVDAANTGLAHGIAGPLAFLAACQMSGHGSDRTVDAIRAAADWLMTWRNGDSWPPQITASDLAGTATAPSRRGRRDAWCYGGPGIGITLMTAGHALHETALTQAGTSAIDALAVRRDTWDTEGATLCHGSAGILLCAQAANRPATVDAALADVTTQCDPDLPFFFRHYDHDQITDEPGLLVGAAGIAATLADYAELAVPTAPTSWAAALLMPPTGSFHSTSATTTEGRFPR